MILSPRLCQLRVSKLKSQPPRRRLLRWQCLCRDTRDRATRRGHTEGQPGCRGCPAGSTPHNVTDENSASLVAERSEILQSLQPRKGRRFQLCKTLGDQRLLLTASTPQGSHTIVLFIGEKKQSTKPLGTQPHPQPKLVVSVHGRSGNINMVYGDQGDICPVIPALNPTLRCHGAPFSRAKTF